MYHLMSRGDQRHDIFLEHHAGELRLESAEAKADRLVAEELRRLGWSAEDLVGRPRNGPDKLAIALRLRRETTLSIKAITARVHLGTYNTANARLHWAMKQGLGAEITQGIIGI
jgi:hypothetical protein